MFESLMKNTSSTSYYYVIAGLSDKLLRHTLSLRMCQAACSTHTHTLARTHARWHRRFMTTAAQDQHNAFDTLSQLRRCVYRQHFFFFFNITHLLEHPAMSCDIDIPNSNLANSSCHVVCQPRVNDASVCICMSLSGPLNDNQTVAICSHCFSESFVLNANSYVLS